MRTVVSVRMRRLGIMAKSVLRRGGFVYERIADKGFLARGDFRWYHRGDMNRRIYVFLLSLCLTAAADGQSVAVAPRSIVLHAARLLDVKSGRILSPGEVLV